MSKRITLTDIEVEYLICVIENQRQLNTKNNSGALYKLARLNLDALYKKLEPAEKTD